MEQVANLITSSVAVVVGILTAVYLGFRMLRSFAERASEGGTDHRVEFGITVYVDSKGGDDA